MKTNLNELRELYNQSEVKFLIDKIVKDNRFLVNRENKCNKIGLDISYVCMGSGGIGQTKINKATGLFCVQIGYGSGRYNFALVVLIPKDRML